MSNASSLVAEAVWKAIESTRSVTDDQLSVVRISELQDLLHHWEHAFAVKVSDEQLAPLLSKL